MQLEIISRKKWEVYKRFLPTNQDLEARVYIKIYDVIQKVEVTIPGNQFILRAEEASDDLYAAIDLVVDKLERQIRRHKTKANKKIREREGISNYFITIDDTPEVIMKRMRSLIK